MSIKQTLSLALSITGATQANTTLKNLQAEATKLSNILGKIRINIDGAGTGSGPVDGIKNTIDEKILKPFNEAIVKAKQFGPQTYREFAKGLKPMGDQTFFDLANFANNQGKLKFTSVNSIDYASINAARQAKEEAKFTEQFVKNIQAQQINMGNQMLQKFKQLKQDRINQINQIYKAEEDKINYIQKRASQLFKTGFGLHIVQIYIAPVLYALEQLSVKMITTFSEFDKKYVDYKVKSEEYGEWLSKGDFYKGSVGQTFGIKDAATAAERFAASGVDVAKSQQALTSVMQVATIAHMDYAEAANGVIKTMQAMHLQVQDVTLITDALINSANASTAELSDLVQWFEYAASSAFQAGLNVQQLSAYLGILASSGTPNTGAAMRQLFLQMSKEDIQGSLMGKFSWIKQEDFAEMDKLILKMREYVRSQTDQKAATLEITRLLGGKANAQQALNNLLMSEPQLWNQVMNAVNATGSTQDLYNKVTNNTSDAIQKIKVNLEILYVQMSEAFGPILKAISGAFTAFTNVVVALPGWFKSLIGVLIVLATAFVGLVFAAMGVIGALAIMDGTLLTLNITKLRTLFLTSAWKAELKLLATQIFGTNVASLSFSNVLKGVNLEMLTAIKSAKTYSATQNLIASGILASIGVMVGYTTASMAMQNKMYDEAHAITILTSAWIALSVARAGGFVNPLAWVGGVAAGASYEALMYNKIENMKRDARLAAKAEQTGVGGSKQYIVNMDNVNINQDGMDLDNLISASTYTDF